MIQRPRGQGTGNGLASWRVAGLATTLLLAASASTFGADAPAAVIAPTQTRPSQQDRADNRTAAIDSATQALMQSLRRAHRGELSTQELRRARTGIEASLGRRLAQFPAVNRPEELVTIELARSRMNQLIIRSQEWEIFGSLPRPEWGWDPQREVAALESGQIDGEIVIATTRS